MTFLFINFVLAAVPAVALLIYFYRRDKQKKEPFSLIWKTFAFGFLAVIPAGLIELFVDAFFSTFTAGWIQSFFKAFVVAALIEESLKLAVVFIFVYRRTEFDEVTDGIVYTITASLGFAFLENLLYSFGPPYVLILRGITAVPLHAIASGLMGYYIGMSKFSGKNMVGRGLFYAILIHGTYNFLLFTGTVSVIGVIPLLIFCWIILRKHTNRALKFDREHGLSSGPSEDSIEDAPNS